MLPQWASSKHCLVGLMQRRGLALLSMSGCSVHTHTHTLKKHTRTHIHFSICTICQDCAELHSTPGWSWQPTEQPLIFNDSIFYTWFHTRPLSRNYAFLRKDYIYTQYRYMDRGESKVHQCAMQQSGQSLVFVVSKKWLHSCGLSIFYFYFDFIVCIFITNHTYIIQGSQRSLKVCQF